MSFETPVVKYGVVLLLAAVVLLPLVSGCQQYGSVSLSAYEVATALYSVCNQQDAARLSVVEEKIDELSASDALSEKESSWLLDIVSRARQGEWSEAMADARTMLKEQVAAK